jgi:hypothetical protein
MRGLKRELRVAVVAYAQRHSRVIHRVGATAKG